MKSFLTYILMQTKENGGGIPIESIIMFVIIGSLVYFILIRKKNQPKVKRVKRRTDNNDTV